MEVQILSRAFVKLIKMLNSGTEIKKYLGWYTGPLLVGMVLALFMFAFWYGVSGLNEWRNTTGVRQISVSGEGKVGVRPDIATFMASVVTQSAKVKDAQEENARRSNDVLTFAKAQGVKEKDLKTVGYSINPQYQYDSRPCIQTFPSPCPQNPPRIVSYEVRSSVEIKVRDLGKVDDLLAGVVSAGANEVGSIQFSIDDEEKIKADARKLAIDDARAKAKVLAKDLSVRLGKIISFSESGGGIPIYARAFEAKGGFGEDVAAPSPQVEPGEQEIKSNVTITYEFR